MTATTARKPRQRKPTTPVLAGWPRFDTQAWEAKRKAVREAHKAIGPVPRFWTQADLAELDRIDAESAEAVLDAIAEVHAEHDEGEQ